MRCKILAGIIAVGAALSTPAYATAITTLSFSGTLQSGYDGDLLFGTNPSNRSIAGKAYSATISYDPLSLSACSSTTTCSWNLTAANSVVETVTINSITKSFNATGGNLQFNTGGGNSQQIVFSPSGGGFSFYGTFQDTNKFFGSPMNVANPQLNFSDVPLLPGSAGGNVGGTSFGFNYSTLSAVTTTTSANVPEPMSLAILGAGLAGLGIARLRRSPK